MDAVMDLRNALADIARAGPKSEISFWLAAKSKNISVQIVENAKYLMSRSDDVYTLIKYRQVLRVFCTGTSILRTSSVQPDNRALKVRLLDAKLPLSNLSGEHQMCRGYSFNYSLIPLGLMTGVSSTLLTQPRTL